jgi:hypothetical protein
MSNFVIGTSAFPAWAGAVGSNDYFRTYRQACAFLADDLS